jgi:hypothetical protein
MKFTSKNTKAKSIKLWTALFIGTIFLWSGCDTESFLTPDPDSFSTTATYYEEPGHFEAAINSAYSRLRTQAGVSDGNFRHINETRSDAMNRHFDINLPGVNAQPFLEWFAVSSNSIPRGQWINIYTTVAQTNIILSRIDAVEFTDQVQKDQIVGQAKFIRALSYWYAVQYWGGVPLVLEENDSPAKALDKSRASEEEVYGAIIADLQDAVSKLPPSWSTPGRATSGAANFLLGRTYLLRENYSGAVDALESVEQSGEYMLVADFISIFNPDNKNNSESILELQFDPNVAEQPDAGMINAVLPWHRRGAIVDNIVNPDSDDNFFPSFEVLEFFDTSSDRYEDTFFWDVDPSNSQYPEIAHRGDSVAIMKKYLWPEYINATGEQDGNIILFRYADALLSLAEAHWRMGNDGDAQTYINRVRNRAGLDNVDLGNVPIPVVLDGTYLESDNVGRAIFNERTVELLAEGHRMLDLRRFGIGQGGDEFVTQVLLNYAGSRKSRESRIQNVFNIQAFEIILPIHPQEIGASNGSITQNPGWGE